MATKLKTKDPLAFLDDIPMDEVQQAITDVVAELQGEYQNLRSAKEWPQPISAADKQLLGTERKDLTTVHLTEWRIAMWEGAQDRLWHWHRVKNGQAAEPAPEGRSSLG